MLIYPVFIPQAGCPFQCIYCDQHKITKSNEPDWQESDQLVANFCNKHKEDKKQIAFYGGTFTALSLREQRAQLSRWEKLLDHNTSIRYSTRPDCLNSAILDQSMELGVKTIELGIQDFNNEILSKSGRGYSTEQAIEACQWVISSGFELGIQLMPGLPGWTDQAIQVNLEHVLRIKPSFVRIYPVIILKDTTLENMYHEGVYTPLSTERAISITAEMVSNLEENDIPVAKIGLHGDLELDKSDIVAGPFHPAFGEMVRGRILSDKIVKTYIAGAKLLVANKSYQLLMGHEKRYLTDAKDKLGVSQIELILSKTMKNHDFEWTTDKVQE